MQSASEYNEFCYTHISSRNVGSVKKEHRGINAWHERLTVGVCSRTLSKRDAKKVVLAASSSAGKKRYSRTSYICSFSPGWTRYSTLNSASTRAVRTLMVLLISSDVRDQPLKASTHLSAVYS